MKNNFTEFKSEYKKRIGNNKYTGLKIGAKNKVIISNDLTKEILNWNYVSVFYDVDNKKILLEMNENGQKITYIKGGGAVLTCNGLKDKMPQGRYILESINPGRLLLGLTKK